MGTLGQILAVLGGSVGVAGLLAALIFSLKLGKATNLLTQERNRSAGLSKELELTRTALGDGNARHLAEVMTLRQRIVKMGKYLEKTPGYVVDRLAELGQFGMLADSDRGDSEASGTVFVEPPGTAPNLGDR